jgi:hypothetical protein
VQQQEEEMEEKREEERVNPIVLVAVGIAALWMHWQFSKEEKREEERESSSLHCDTYHPVNYSNPRNNHDDRKIKYPTQEAAESAVRGMQRSGRDGSERLKVYYNHKLEGWYVGRSR